MSPTYKRVSAALMSVLSIGAVWLALTEPRDVAVVFVGAACWAAIIGHGLRAAAQHDELVAALQAANDRADDRAGVPPRLAPLPKD